MKNRIKELRQLNNMTLLEVSKSLGVAESTVQRYESGAIENLKYETMVKLANLFHTTPAYLMGWAEAATPYDPLKNANWDKVEELYGWPRGIIDLIRLYNSFDDAGKEQLLQYGQFLLSQKEK